MVGCSSDFEREGLCKSIIAAMKMGPLRKVGGSARLNM